MAAARYMARMDPILIPTDDLCKKWASGGSYGAGQGRSLHPLEAMRLLHDGAVLGGSDAPLPQEIVILDSIIASGPSEVRVFVGVWYRDSSPVYLKAERLNVSRTTIYTDLKGHLQYLRGRLHAKGIRV